jgi:hypothetical protein
VSAAVGRIIALVGVALIAVGVFQPAFFGVSYWKTDDSIGWTGLILACAAALFALLGFVRPVFDGWSFAIGAALTGYYGWLPAATASHSFTGAGWGFWLTFAGALLITIGGALAVAGSGRLHSTPAGLPVPTVVAGVGMVIAIVGIFLKADSGSSYWEGPFGHTLGITMLTVTILAIVVWVLTVIGKHTRGLDVLLTLIMLGLFAYEPISRALFHFGYLQKGAWITFLGAVLAVIGTWAARADEAPEPVAESRAVAKP